jgi:hypothetical protein
MLAMLRLSPIVRERQGAELAGHVARHFSIETMADSVLEGYAEAMARRGSHRSKPRLSNLPSSA